jgi:hypothetical protein
MPEKARQCWTLLAGPAENRCSPVKRCRHKQKFAASFVCRELDVHETKPIAPITPAQLRFS